MEIGGRISQSVDTVRALHQTILSLRTALEQSRSEIDELKARFGPSDVDDRLRSLTAENHILRQKLSRNFVEFKEHAKPRCKDGAPKLRKQSKKQEQGNSDCDSDTNLYVSTETISSSKVSKSLENLSFVKPSVKRGGSSKKNLSKSKTVTFSNVSEGDKQISTTNSFVLKTFTKCRQSESGQLKKARNLQSFSEEIIRDKREIGLGELREQNIVQEVNLKTRKKIKVQKGNFDFKENIEIQPESVSNQLLQEIELQKILHGNFEEQNSEDRGTKRAEGEKEIKPKLIISRQLKTKETRKHKNVAVELSQIKQVKEEDIPKSSPQLKTKETHGHKDVTAEELDEIKQVKGEDATTSRQLKTRETREHKSVAAEAEEPSKIKRVKEEKIPKTSSQLKTKDTLGHKNNVTAEELDEIKQVKVEDATTSRQLKTAAETEALSETKQVEKEEDTIISEQLETKETQKDTEKLEGLKQVSGESDEGTPERVTPQEIESKSPAASPQTNVVNSESSDTETPSNNGIRKSSQLGEVLETALFGDRKKKEESQERISPETHDVLVSGEPQIAREFQLESTTTEDFHFDVNLQNTEAAPDKKEEAKFEEKEKDDTDTSGTLCSSDDKTVNNVEVSVKIFKGPNRKPIEIDVQTKRVKKGKKKQAKTEMNDKSQNTSFDNDGGFPQSHASTEFRTMNVIQNSENIVQNLLQNDTEQEVDDIELIFTTDDTKDTDFKEELVSIEPYASSQLLQCPQAEYDEKGDVSDRELEDDVFNDNFEGESCGFQSQTFDFRREQSQIYNSKSDNSINHEDKSLKSYYSYQGSSFENKSLEKDESFDRFEEKVRIVETDMSKVGIQDVDYNMGRRNTCPNPLQYRPIMHREALGRGLNSRKCRPILAHSNVVRKECGAQTDISAIPGSSWRSESSLAHKVKIGENFTTLPSKFPHPASRLKLSEKTVEARRVLLSDIGFTSMVPELSRSADHLCPPNMKAPSTTTYGQFLRTSDLYSPGYTSQKFMWTATATPSEGSHSQSRYSSQYPLSSPPAPMRRCSAPVSPSRRAATLKSTPSRVRFANGSLPELRGDWTTTVDSGESTDSLVEEAEHFLRRSIDCLAPTRDILFRSDQTKGTMRRASAPEPSRDNVPPPGWQPFLPRVPRDLHLDYWVKVISQEGRVRGGRVRYVGPLMSQADQFVGVQLSTPDGHSDGTFNNRRYFNCEPYHGIFVPFKKIIMGWRP